MENDLISVVIPAYNRETTIRDCIDSVLAQTYKNIEVIVVDDCSSDKTADIVDSYNDSRVRKCIKLEENHGACYARNKGAFSAEGKYIAFQDSDDTWFPQKLEKQMAYLLKGNYDFVFCGMERVYVDKVTYVPSNKFYENGDVQRQILFANPCSTQCMFMTKELFEKVTFDETIKRYQDWDFFIRASEIAKIGYLEEALVHSEVQSDSITRKVNRFESLKVIYKKYCYLIENDKLLKANFFRKFGDEFWHSDKKRAYKYYKRSLELEFNKKIAVKCFLAHFI